MHSVIPSKHFYATMCKFLCLLSFASKLIKNKNLKERLIITTIILPDEKSFLKLIFAVSKKNGGRRWIEDVFVRKIMYVVLKAFMWRFSEMLSQK